MLLLAEWRNLIIYVCYYTFTPRLFSVYFQSVTGIWTPGVDDATCVALNHKYKLMAFGRKK